MTLDFNQIITGILTALALPAVGLLAAAVRSLYKISKSLITIIEEWEGVKKKILLFDSAHVTIRELVEDNEVLMKWYNSEKVESD